ncbi:MAG: hypothetical protein CM15mP49_13890 [Actinomycetota bacterium]|nr:MAG: hypothetical protein CM15mP49_13890 [Actinomycetota bacterium]
MSIALMMTVSSVSIISKLYLTPVISEKVKVIILGKGKNVLDTMAMRFGSFITESIPMTNFYRSTPNSFKYGSPF